MAEIVIKIGADTSDAVKGIGGVTDKLNDLPAATQRVGDGMKRSVASINSAAFALNNVGRVAQDLPFGFIGIQNNLNPLLESFQRLKVETGSNVGALKALGSSLMGAGGIGLALSVVSSAILLYQKYIQSSTDETKKNSEAIKLSINDYDRFAKELEQVTATLGTESAKVSILFSALSDANIGLRERKGILEQLNQISPGYLGNLDKEKAGYAEITKAVFAYTDSLAKSAEIKGLLPQVDKLFQGLINAQIELNQLRRFGTSDKNFFGVSPEDFAAEEKRLTGVIKSFTNQIKIAKAGLTNFAGGEVNLSEILFGKTPELKVAKDIKEKVVKELKRRDYAPAILHIQTSAEILFDLEQAQKEADKKLGNHKLKTKIEIQADIQHSDQAPAGDFIPTSTQIGAQLKAGLISYQDFKNKIIQMNQDMADSLHGTLNAAFASIGEGIAESLSSGADFGKAVFGTLFKVLGAGIKQLGESMIALGTAKIVIEKFKFSPGIGTVLAGIATVAIGALLQKAIPGFAAGVTNFAGGLAVVGERGPELVRLPRGSDVIPNHRLGGIGGMEPIIIIPNSRIRGQDIVTSYTLARQTIGRNG